MANIRDLARAKPELAQSTWTSRLPPRPKPLRFVSLYAPNGREVGSPSFESKVRLLERLHRWLVETRASEEKLVLGGDLNVTPAGEDVWAPEAATAGLMYQCPSGRRSSV